MNKFRKNGGFASIFLLIFALIFLVIAIGFALDVLGYIDVPKEYSLTRFLDYTVETTYKPDTIDTDKKVVKKKTNTGKNEETDNNLEVYKSNKNTNTNENNEKSNENTIYKRFYYLQLDSHAKKIYDGIMDNIEELKTGTYTIDFGKEFNSLLNTSDGAEKLNNYFQSAVNAVLLDNPEIFYLDITKMYLLTKSTTYAFTGTTYEVSIGPSENQSYLVEGFSESDIRVAESTLSNIKSGIVRNIDNEDVVKKVKKVHDYLVDNLDYDSTFSQENIYNMYGALVNNLTVCEGYAKAFKSLMDELNVPCVVVCGYAQNSKGETENHAWNYVLIDDNWYAIDVTWDDPIIIGGGVLSTESRYKYFLKGSDSLFMDHQEDGEVVSGANFSYPNISKTDY